jgi:ABC-type phosphate transport system substrate-binding protein
MVLIVGFASDAAQAEDLGFVVIVNPDNPTRSIARDALSDIMLKKVTKWSDGQTVQPVDRDVGSFVRGRFSAIVHRKSVGAIKSYWQQQIFTGRAVPPVELRSDAEVVAYVQRTYGAVGYVASSANLGGTKVLTIRE